MEQESFEDEEVAELLNQDFICIKVDREERPDIDAVYMSVCQMVTGSGGWPMTIMMTPEQKPFFAATYLPKLSRYGINGMMELLPFIGEQWKTNRNHLLETGNKMSGFLREQTNTAISSQLPDKEFLKKAISQFEGQFDKKYGGFGSAPKFPTPHNLIFLLRYSKLSGDYSGKEMAEKTLQQMFCGGIFDQIGGGFSRYSTDAKWLVPHFEKMLYDNALLSYAYWEAYQMTGRLLYERAAVRTLEYVLDELTDPLGGFYCGQDADSDGIEGRYYVFDEREVMDVLGDKKGNVFNEWFDITKEGNFEGKSIPNLLSNDQYENTNTRIQELCGLMYEYRLKRNSLHKDDKILTSWNALMIAAFAKAFSSGGDKRYLEAAKKAVKFIQTYLTDSNDRLQIRWRKGEAVNNGQLDDYAFYAWALLELYEASFEVLYLKESLSVARLMMKLFFDYKNGGFYLYAWDSEQLIIRPKEVYDGAIPSGNSVAALVLNRLGKITGESCWQEYLHKQFMFLAGNIAEYPAGYSFSLMAMEEILFPSKELVCVLSNDSSTKEVREALMKQYKPNLTVLVKTRENEEALSKLVSYTLAYPIPVSGIYCYLCENGTCKAPVEINQLQLD